MTSVTSAVAGRAVALAAVPEPVFSVAVAGPGTAVYRVREPSTALAPADGVMVLLHPHVFAAADEEGAVLTRPGIGTVRLDGEGFQVLVARGGTTVRRGEPAVRWNPAAVESRGMSPVCPGALEAFGESLPDLVGKGDVEAGTRLFLWS